MTRKKRMEGVAEEQAAIQETHSRTHLMRPLGSGLALIGGVANTCILVSWGGQWWSAASSVRYEPAIPYWNEASTLGFLITVLVLSVLGVVLALLMLKTLRLPSLLLIVVSGLATVVSLGAALLWAFLAVYLVPGSVVQFCGGVLGLLSGDPRNLGG